MPKLRSKRKKVPLIENTVRANEVVFQRTRLFGQEFNKVKALRRNGSITAAQEAAFKKFLSQVCSGMVEASLSPEGHIQKIQEEIRSYKKRSHIN